MFFVGNFTNSVHPTYLTQLEIYYSKCHFELHSSKCLYLSSSMYYSSLAYVSLIAYHNQQSLLAKMVLCILQLHHCATNIPDFLQNSKKENKNNSTRITLLQQYFIYKLRAALQGIIHRGQFAQFKGKIFYLFYISTYYSIILTAQSYRKSDY